MIDEDTLRTPVGLSLETAILSVIPLTPEAGQRLLRSALAAAVRGKRSGDDGAASQVQQDTERLLGILDASGPLDWQTGAIGKAIRALSFDREQHAWQALQEVLHGQAALGLGEVVALDPVGRARPSAGEQG